jgi:hypothetical protein
MTHRRVTLVCRDSNVPDRDWSLSLTSPSRVVVTERLEVVRYALGADAAHMGVDVERIVIDQPSTSDAFLSLIAELPHHFNGDALCIRQDGSGFLSAAGRGDGRVLYSLKPSDVRFYLETAGVVTGQTILRDHFIAVSVAA